MFFNWTRIREITDLYLAKAGSAMKEGTFFYPHALGFMADVGEGKNGLHVAVPPLMVHDRKGFDSFIKYVSYSLPKQGRIEAAGFILCVPRALAAEIFPGVVTAAVSNEPADYVGAMHVEHVYEGVQTWVLNNPLRSSWELKASGIVTAVPTCLPARAYGVAVGSA